MPHLPHWPRTASVITSAYLLLGSAWGAPQDFIVITHAGESVASAAVSVLVKGTPTTAGPSVSADMSQRQKSFVPSLLVVQTGTAVNFPNFDTVRHHVYSFSSIKTFEIKLYAGTPSKPVVFDKAGTATLGCNIHDRMLAYIHVVDTPYFGVTDGLGRTAIDLPPGEHTVRVWTASMGETHPGITQTMRVGQGPITVRVSNP